MPNSSAPAVWQHAAAGLAARVLGARAAASTGFTEPPGSASETPSKPRRGYSVQARNGQVQVTATDGIAACVGLHRYLRSALGTRITWGTSLPLSPGAFPDLAPVTGGARVSGTYYMNFCTSSYTTSFWDWSDWEREIDWMALHGVSMPLTTLGHDAVLVESFRRLGVSERAALAHATGPAYQAFWYMGCLEGVDPPASRSPLDESLRLATLVIERQRALGMTPVLPGFTGLVPSELADRPGVTTATRTWQGFTSRALSASDPLYRDVVATVATVQAELLGTDHLYAVDPFIEVEPGEGHDEPELIAEATLAGLVDADPEATWLLQAWPFSYLDGYWTNDRLSRFLDSIDPARVHLLDLWAEADPQWRRTDGFRGKPWSWCGLLNFGGRTDPVGSVAALVDGFTEALASASPPDGLGIAMEGTQNNPILVEIATDLAWSDSASRSGLPRPAEVAVSRERYGPHVPPGASEAWAFLGEVLYGVDPLSLFPENPATAVTTRPDYELLVKPSPWKGEVEGANRLARGWSGLLDAAEAMSHPPQPLLNDLVDVTSAILQRLADAHMSRALVSLRSGDPHREHLEAFLEILDQLDEVTATGPGFRLATWEARAAEWARSSQQGEGASSSARRLLTTWSPEPGMPLEDYAARLWSGLLDYYGRRWRLWCDGIDAARLDWRGAQAALKESLDEMARAFVDHGAAPPRAPGTTVLVVRRVWELRHADLIAFRPHDPNGASSDDIVK